MGGGLLLQVKVILANRMKDELISLRASCVS